MNTIRLWPLDDNQILLFDTNEIWLLEEQSGLPDKWEENNPDISFIGGSDIKKVSRTASTPRIGGSGGLV